MYSIVLLFVLCICSSYAGQVTYSARSGDSVSGARLITAPAFTGGYAPSAPVIPILSYDSYPNKGDGTYSHSYLTGNGIAGQESGQVSSHKSGTEAHGSYSYTGPDGQQYTVTYTAGANGFVPQGAHLPTPPPIPEEIQKSLTSTSANYQSDFTIAKFGPEPKPSIIYGTSQAQRRMGKYSTLQHHTIRK